MKDQVVRIVVERFRFGHEATISRVFVGRQFVCYGLERHEQGNDSRIPTDTYNVAVHWPEGHKRDYRIGERLGMLKIEAPRFPNAVICSSEHSAQAAVGSLVIGTTIGAVPLQPSLRFGDLAFGKVFILVATACERGQAKITYRQTSMSFATSSVSNGQT